MYNRRVTFSVTLETPKTVAVASFRLRREQVFSPSERKEVVLMNLHDLAMAALLAINLVLEYIMQHKKR